MLPAEQFGPDPGLFLAAAQPKVSRDTLEPRRRKTGRLK